MQIFYIEVAIFSLVWVFILLTVHAEVIVLKLILSFIINLGRG